MLKLNDTSIKLRVFYIRTIPSSRTAAFVITVFTIFFRNTFRSGVAVVVHAWIHHFLYLCKKIMYIWLRKTKKNQKCRNFQTVFFFGRPPHEMLTSQKWPLYPLSQTHVEPSKTGKQVPLFLQGFVNWQKLVCSMQYGSINPGMHKQDGLSFETVQVPYSH